KNRHKTRHIQILKRLTGRATPLLVIAIIITIFIQFSITLTPTQENILMTVDKIIILIFSIDLITDYMMSRSKKEFFRKRWFSFIIFLPLFNIIGRMGPGSIKLLGYGDIISRTDPGNLLRFLENSAINPALKAGHITNISTKLTRTSYILEKIRSI
ncbi:MAG: hypothetical protein U9P44_04010, partial [archaeon]|nr:hypothetical protein [archaeon]